MAKRVGTESGVRRSAAQGRALVKRWRGSGESVTSFCRRAGVGAHVLRYWLGRETGSGKPVGSAGDFFVVATPQRSSDTESASEKAAAARTMTSAFIVVVPEASPAVLARTVRELLAETRS
ncbi:MAG TPA: hypothetical protein VGB13_12835 [Candidatus Krumholzibacteria bacterium]